MFETEYIPPLTALDYVDRLLKQLVLPDIFGEQAKNLIHNGNVRGTSPTIIAASAVIEEAQLIESRTDRRRRRVDQKSIIDKLNIYIDLLRLTLSVP
jgi:transcription initiation factor TFIIIB Brf1 subunit/transcription initiation factor TFIIB